MLPTVRLGSVVFAAVLLAFLGCGGEEGASVCGDGARSGDAQCEDGLLMDVKPLCGNGILEAPEQCEDGNTVGGDECEHNCTLPVAAEGSQEEADRLKDPGAPRPVCGNGSIEAPEQCDDGNIKGGDGCEHNCTLPVADAGSRDAGTKDSWDAGSRDAGTKDSWDAGSRDAGTKTDAA